MGNGKYGQIRHFTDIEAWKIGREIRKEVYTLIKMLPEEDKIYSLIGNAIRTINGYIKLLQRQQQTESKKKIVNGK